MLGGAHTQPTHAHPAHVHPAPTKHTHTHPAHTHPAPTRPAQTQKNTQSKHTQPSPHTDPLRAHSSSVDTLLSTSSRIPPDQSFAGHRPLDLLHWTPSGAPSAAETRSEKPPSARPVHDKSGEIQFNFENTISNKKIPLKLKEYLKMKLFSTCSICNECSL